MEISITRIFSSILCVLTPETLNLLPPCLDKGPAFGPGSVQVAQRQRCSGQCEQEPAATAYVGNPNYIQLQPSCEQSALRRDGMLARRNLLMRA